MNEALKHRAGKLAPNAHRNMYKINVLLKAIDENKEIEYRFPYEHLSYEEACRYESELIEKYGRRSEGTGLLTNLDSGGRGGMTRSQETCDKISEALSGRESPLKGRKLGEYSEERKIAATNGRTLLLNDPIEGPIHRKAISDGQKGKVISQEHKDKISKTLKGRPSPMKGKKAWNSGKTKETDERLKYLGEQVSKTKQLNPKPAWNKGGTTPLKGKTYEEIYGAKKAAEMKTARQSKIWIHDGDVNKKINKDELDIFIADGWVKGRLVPWRKKCICD